VLPGVLKRSIYNRLPTPIRIQGPSFFRNYLLDLSDRLNGRADPNIPPRHLNISGDGPFSVYGRNTVELCRKYAGLQADDAVLDIGCGIGRTAIALTDFLQPPGRYAGFDVIRFAIAWCKKHIQSRNPVFVFTHADVQNQTYNPAGAEAASHYRFPYEEAGFTFALATSVFTHLMPNAAERYIAEAARVLRSGGKFLSTWFLLEESSDSMQTARLATERFPYQFERHAQASLHAPEQAVAYRKGYVKRVFAANNFVIEGIHKGDWSEPPDHIESMQDVIVASRD
jgi:SAM-dependent methyltransferase